MERQLNKEKVIITLYPGCISFEVALTAELLSEKYDVITVSPDGRDLGGSSGLPLKVQHSYAQVSLENCKAVIVPGGDPGSIVANTEIDRILRNADKLGLLIGGICAGPFALAKAGILKGRKISHGYEPEQIDLLKSFFSEVILTNDPFTVDGNIVTAKPDAHIDFAVEIACRLEAVDASKSGRLKEYYRGTLGRKIRPLALALLKNANGQLLLHKAHDCSKNEVFYRPLGGGIEFYETGRVTIEREIYEELDLKVSVKNLVATFENIFTYEGQRGHEIVMLFDTEFNNPKDYERKEIDIVESGCVIGKAVWRSIEEIRSEGAKLYPQGIEESIKRDSI